MKGDAKMEQELMENGELAYQRVFPLSLKHSVAQGDRSSQIARRIGTQLNLVLACIYRGTCIVQHVALSVVASLFVIMSDCRKVVRSISAMAILIYCGGNNALERVFYEACFTPVHHLTVGRYTANFLCIHEEVNKAASSAAAFSWPLGFDEKLLLHATSKRPRRGGGRSRDSWDCIAARGKVHFCKFWRNCRRRWEKRGTPANNTTGARNRIAGGPDESRILQEDCTITLGFRRETKPENGGGQSR